MPSRERVDESRDKLRKDSEDPRILQSSTDIDDERRAKLRSEREEPMNILSKMLTALNKALAPQYTASDDPSRAKVRRESDDPK